ncbi:MAG: glycosyltransferase family 39 protein [bacterium]|nr:glycosyltransferase family 39 protein [bacterium]
MDFLIRNHKRIIWLIVLAAFIVAVSYAFYFRIQPIVDAKSYDEMAWNLVQGGEYSVSDIYRPGPGYSFFLAAIYFIFGHSYEAVWIIQSLLFALMALFAFLISRLIFDDDRAIIVGFVASILLAISPDLITVNAMLMTETFTIFMSMVATYFLMKYIKDGSWPWLILTSVFVSLAALGRANVVLLVIPLMLLFVIRKNWRHGFIGLAIIFLMLTPWTVRNYLAYGIFKPFNSAGGGLLAVGNHPGASGELEEVKWPDEYNKMSQIDFDKAARGDAIDFIKHHPFEFAQITLKRVSVYLSLSRPTGFWFHLDGLAQQLTLATSALHTATLFILGLLGAVLIVKRYLRKNLGQTFKKRWAEFTMAPAFYLLLIAIMMPLSILLIVVETRYRYPLYPFLAILGGYGFVELVTNFRQNWRSLLGVSGLLIVNTIIDVVRNWSKIFGRLINL